MAGFSLRAYRFRFQAAESVYFPPGKAGNIVRGALGTVLRRLACAPECHDARTCPQRATCAYARLFEPTALENGPSGFADLPRPFVFRATHLDGKTIAAGEAFRFDIHVFYPDEFALAYLVRCFAQLADEGLGPRRGKARLTGVDQMTAEGSMVQVYDGSALVRLDPPAPLRFSLEPPAWRAGKLLVRFLTPTELKESGVPAPRPEFSVLFARVRDRISNLCALYGEGAPDIDYAALGARARSVRLVRCEVEQVHAERRSSKTGQRHPIGGFVGEAEYEGELTEFMPYLELAHWTGVGRQTVWGKGVITVSRLVD